MRRRIKYLKTKDPRSRDFNQFILNNYPEFLTEKKPDLILASGGDGTMLHSIQTYHQLEIPFIGNAAGTLNFLMNEMEDYKKAIHNLLNPEIPLHIIETTSIKVDVNSGRKISVNIGYAVNDVVIGSSVMGYHTYKITSEDSSFENFLIKGTGISVCTDLGSTGYNFNLGGPILPLGSNLWAVEGIVCNRYLNDLLPVGKLIIYCDKADKDVSIYIDGINKGKLNSGQGVSLITGHPIKIAFLNKTDFIKKRVEITSRYRKY